MRRPAWRTRAAALLALLLLAGPGAATAQEGAQAEMADVLRVGFVLPPLHDGDDETNEIADAVTEAARQGATLAAEEFGLNAQMLGGGLEVVFAEADDGPSAAAAAERLLDEEGAFILAGGYGLEAADALGRVAEERRVPFLNIGESSDALRNEQCRAATFHVEPSAAMYLDALAGWFIRSEFRDWFVVYADDGEGEARYQRFRWTIRNRHFGAREAGRAALSPGDDVEGVLRSIDRSRADVVLLLLDTEGQLAFLEAYEAAGQTLPVTGFPEPTTQTRRFLEASLAAAPVAGSGYRAAAWEATLDAYGARELNERYNARWGQPMDAPAWAAYQAVKIAFEITSFTGSEEGETLLAYLTDPTSVFDVWKGIGVTFRPWDQQLRQPLYLIGINEEAENPRSLAVLVGELPAIYMPRTEPVERLDQLGDLSRESRCSF